MSVFISLFSFHNYQWNNIVILGVNRIRHFISARAQKETLNNLLSSSQAYMYPLPKLKNFCEASASRTVLRCYSWSFFLCWFWFWFCNVHFSYMYSFHCWELDLITSSHSRSHKWFYKLFSECLRLGKFYMYLFRFNYSLNVWFLFQIMTSQIFFKSSDFSCPHWWGHCRQKLTRIILENFLLAKNAKTDSTKIRTEQGKGHPVSQSSTERTGWYIWVC